MKWKNLRIKLLRIAEATPCMHTYVQKFADKTFVEGGYAAKFAKVFTRKNFRLYSIFVLKTLCIFFPGLNLCSNFSHSLNIFFSTCTIQYIGVNSDISAIFHGTDHALLQVQPDSLASGAGLSLANKESFQNFPHLFPGPRLSHSSAPESLAQP